MMINKYVPFVVPAGPNSDDAFRRVWHLTGTQVPVGPAANLSPKQT